MDGKKWLSDVLGLGPDWLVTVVTEDAGRKKLRIRVERRAGSAGLCPECGRSCRRHGTREHEWQTLDVWDYRTFIVCAVPRVECPEHGVVTLPAPWPDGLPKPGPRPRASRMKMTRASLQGIVDAVVRLAAKWLGPGISPGMIRMVKQNRFAPAIMARCWTVVLAVASATMPASLVGAQRSDAEDLAFQLYTACQPINLFVESFRDDEEDIGLSRQAVVNAAESRLRAARMYNDAVRAWFLYIRINVVGLAFRVDVQFKRRLFQYNRLLNGLATTWETSTTGTHGKDAQYILGILSEYLDSFLVDFLRVNEPACDGPG